MKENIQIVFGLLGGLAVFIYGMNMMSECLQKAAGEKMKKILSLLTRNPVMGALAGMLVTAVLQSSSATTVRTFLLYLLLPGVFLCCRPFAPVFCALYHISFFHSSSSEKEK